MPDAEKHMEIESTTHLGLTVGANGMVSEANLIAFPRSIDVVVAVEGEEVAAHGAVVHSATTLRLVTADNLPAILVDEFSLFGALLDEDAPTGEKKRKQEKMKCSTSVRK